MKQTMGSYPQISIFGNKEAAYYMHRARVMRAEHIADLYRLIGGRIMRFFKSKRHTPAKRAGDAVQI